MCWREPLEKGLSCMHDLEHAEALGEVAERDRTALRGMADETVFGWQSLGFMHSGQSRSC